MTTQPWFPAPALVPALALACLLPACAPAAPPAPLPAAAPAPAAADPVQAALERITPEAIRAHVRFLADDLLEGRAPATRGGDLAALYLAAQYEQLGLEAPRGSYFQPVTLREVTADPRTIELSFSGPGGSYAGAYPADFVSWTATQQPLAETAAEVVFVGYGVRAPEQEWDDYAGVDVRGRIVMMLVNDPGGTEAEPDRFGGRRMTYYGRWTYKFEEAERQGAAGAILVHTTESAGYPWAVVEGSWTGPQYKLPLGPGRSPLVLEGWVTEDAARRILALAGDDLDRLARAARERGFRAVETGVTARSLMRSTISEERSPNVVGLLRGRSDELITYTAHYDHLGIGAPVDGDSIYSGALDNASGVAVMLEVARAFAALEQPPLRSVLFIATTAEESGLLGAHYYARNPLYPLERTVASFNLDGTNLFGRTRDVTPMGGDRSTLGSDLDAVLQRLGMRTTPDPFPERGYFFRSDHFPFALAGVPALWLRRGIDYMDHPPGHGQRLEEEYVARDYHQPSDRFREDFDLRGAVQAGQIYFLVGLRVAEAPGRPEWHSTSEFQRP
jgi:Zn-dependent M28 family amino/carboxypeptidase